MRIEDFAGRHRGERCVVIGNGPSLNALDLSLLRGAVTFTCNRGYLLFDRIGGPSTYWVVEDVLDVMQFSDEFNEIEGLIKFAPTDLQPMLRSCVDVPFARDRFDGTLPKFGLRPPFYWGATVSYLMLQLAIYMGCSEIVLVGHDFAYSDNGISTTDGVWTINTADANHFVENYWPIGARAFAADPTAMRKAFIAARAAGEALGVSIVNATTGSQLDVFDRVEYERACGVAA